MANITFMIGNGFDLACGLKSKYTDTYDGYINSKKGNESEAVIKFKGLINGDIESWANFELALAKYAIKFQSSDEVKECVRDYKAYLYDYLQKEQENFWKRNEKLLQSKNEILNEIGRSLTQFYLCLKPYDIDNISPCFGDKSVNYHFITFNYTDIFYKIVKSAFKHGEISKYLKSVNIDSDAIHIHGKLGSDLILGLDNIKQLSGLPYTLSDAAEIELIKASFLSIYDRRRLKLAKETISNSDVICVFGLSLGDSDMSWREQLAFWLNSEYHAHHLVYYSLDNMSKIYHPSAKPQMVEDENNLKYDFIRLLYGDSVDETTKHNVINRIHFPLGAKIFNFDKALFNNESE